MLKVLAVTGSRADYGLIVPVMEALRADPAFTLQLAVTGQHLVREAGSTEAVIAADGFAIDARIDMEIAGDSALAVAEALGRGTIGIARALNRLKPDLLLVPGDRYEMIGVAAAALIARIPVAHLFGGDVTEGALDNSIRHAVTKLSHIHFVTNEAAARRVRLMGEDPAHVHVVGSPGLDRVRLLPTLGREAFFAAIDFTPRPRNLIVTFHPATVEGYAEAQAAELLAGLDALGPDVGLIFTGSNADVEAQRVTAAIAAFASTRDNARLYPSLGQKLYFSALRHVDAVVGNSSSGLYEAPSFAIPTVNVGARQDGRLKAASVVDCPPERGAIAAAITRALALDCAGTVNPYGDGHSSGRIVAVLKALGDPQALIRKRFFETA